MSDTGTRIRLELKWIPTWSTKTWIQFFSVVKRPRDDDFVYRSMCSFLSFYKVFILAFYSPAVVLTYIVFHILTLQYFLPLITMKQQNKNLSRKHRNEIAKVGINEILAYHFYDDNQGSNYQSMEKLNFNNLTLQSLWQNPFFVFNQKLPTVQLDLTWEYLCYRYIVPHLNWIDWLHSSYFCHWWWAT